MKQKPRYNLVDEMRLPPKILEDTFRDATKFKPDKQDVIVATYPKCGTTWAMQIVSMILRKAQPHTNAFEFFSTSPYLEMTVLENVDKLPKPRSIKTHLPFNLIQFSREAKYIWVARHPADCLVSLYHHNKFFPDYEYSDGDFDDFFEIFLKGEVCYNDYFDHLLSWYELREEPNILCLTYESMKMDLRGAVLKVARHIGEEHYQSLLRNNEELLKKVLYYCSFEYMQTAVNSFYWEKAIDPPKDLHCDRVSKHVYQLVSHAKKNGYRSVGQFIRKGIVGEGKIILSDEQMKRLNERITEKTGHSDIMTLWENC